MNYLFIVAMLCFSSLIAEDIFERYGVSDEYHRQYESDYNHPSQNVGDVIEMAFLPNATLHLISCAHLELGLMQKYFMRKIEFAIEQEAIDDLISLIDAIDIMRNDLIAELATK